MDLRCPTDNSTKLSAEKRLQAHLSRREPRLGDWRLQRRLGSRHLQQIGETRCSPLRAGLPPRISPSAHGKRAAPNELTSPPGSTKHQRRIRRKHLGTNIPNNTRVDAAFKWLSHQHTLKCITWSTRNIQFVICWCFTCHHAGRVGGCFPRHPKTWRVPTMSRPMPASKPPMLA